MQEIQKRIDGKAISACLLDDIKNSILQLSKPPTLAVILVGNNPASQIYVTNKVKTCTNVGIKSIEYRLDENVSSAEIAEIINKLNNDKNVNGILLQLPLPTGIDSGPLIQLINPDKDVDGLTIPNIGKLVAGIDGMVPCTPQGALILIKKVIPNLSGKNAVIIGRSLLFGKPMAQLLLGENCTVTMAHSKTVNLPNICANADILVAAVGCPKMVKKDWVKPNAIIIDVGINRMDNGKLCGDVDYDAVFPVASFITPVPGGVGPMTIACLMANTLKAYKIQNV